MEIKHVPLIELDFRMCLDTLRRLLDHLKQTAHHVLFRFKLFSLALSAFFLGLPWPDIAGAGA